MKRVLVTGCAGFIGSHLAEALIKKGDEVWGIDNFHPYYDPEIKKYNIEQIKKTAKETEGHFNFIKGSILNDEDLDKIPGVHQIYHLAALAGVRNSILDPVDYSQINLVGTKKLLHKYPAAKFIFASSSSVYGEVPEDELPAEEDRILKPKAPYALSKKHGEEVCKMFSEIYGHKICILRFYSVYGPRQRPDEAFTKFIRKALNNKPIPIYGTGEQTRDFTYVKDIVQGCISAAEKGKMSGEVYNLGCGRRVSVNEMINVLEKALGEELETKHVTPPEGDVANTQADITKAKEELDYEPKMPLEEGAKKTVEWGRKLYDKGIL